MQDLKVTLAQIDQVWEDKKANFSLYESCFQQLENSDLVVLPEMFHTGFSMNVNELAEDWDDSEGITFLQEWAKKIDSAIYTSLIIKENGNYYNRGVFVYPNGKVVKYDKRKSFSLGGENKFFKAGAEEVIVDWKGWKINLQICYDLRFPELVRNRIVYGSPAYDILLYVANWPEKRIAHWEALLKARAIENQSFVVGVNRVGTDGNGLIYNGGSRAISPLGESIVNCTNNQHEFKKCTVSKIALQDIRTQLPFLMDI